MALLKCLRVIMIVLKSFIEWNKYRSWILLQQNCSIYWYIP